MATIVTVHGTWANCEPAADGADVQASPSECQWWQKGSAFEHELRNLLGAEDGQLEIAPFSWSGANSVMDRRKAGSALRVRLLELEARNEKYCIVAHSHGGSVVSSALLECGGRRQKLPGLQRWITIGTPFIDLRKEPLLLTRLDLVRKVVFVASTMLFLMFLVYAVAEWMSSEPPIIGNTFRAIVIVAGIMTTLPIVFFYGVLKWLDSRSLLHHRSGVRKRAAEYFGPRWRSLTHPDDEAVQGLGFLPKAKLQFFDTSFAVSSITLLSVLTLPLLYLSVVNTPPVMVGIADWMKTHVYDVGASPEVEKSLRDMSRRWRGLRESRRRSAAPEAASAVTAEREQVRKEYRAARKSLEQQHGDIRAAERAFRFKQRFFEHNDQPCTGGKLCGEGGDIRVNSALLLHIATDELSWAFGGVSSGQSWLTRIWALLLPAILVPLICGLLALALMVVIGWFARVLSDGLSRLLNSLTRAEVQRAAFGNDSEAEIAVAAIDRPTWLDRSPPRLPSALAEMITQHSDGEASRSISKFRRMIGELSTAERMHAADTAITTYFTWKELVHSAYFDVPAFAKLVARTMAADGTGLMPSPAFQADPDFGRAGQWLAEIEGAPGVAPPGTTPPAVGDAAAVSAVLASTVKAEP